MCASLCIRVSHSYVLAWPPLFRMSGFWLRLQTHSHACTYLSGFELGLKTSELQLRILYSKLRQESVCLSLVVFLQLRQLHKQNILVQQKHTCNHAHATETYMQPYTCIRNIHATIHYTCNKNMHATVHTYTYNRNMCATETCMQQKHACNRNIHACTKETHQQIKQPGLHTLRTPSGAYSSPKAPLHTQTRSTPVHAKKFPSPDRAPRLYQQGTDSLNELALLTLQEKILI